MLSIRSIIRELGKNIIIYPFDQGRLKGVGYNLSVGLFGWSLRHKKELKVSTDELFFEIESGDTALIMTAETVWVSKKIGGTFHSKVDRVSEGFSSISTTLDPEWIGPLLIAITNMSDTTLNLKKGNSISTLIFHKIEKAEDSREHNPPGRTDRLNALGIQVGVEAVKWIGEVYRNNKKTLKGKVISEGCYKEIKKVSNRLNYLKNILVWVPTIFVLLFLIPAYLRGATYQELGPYLAALAATIGIPINYIVRR